MTTEKRCCICKRTENELNDECALNPKLEEIDCSNWGSIYVCEVCKDVITSMMLSGSFALIMSDLQEAIEHTTYEVNAVAKQPDPK